MKKRWIGYAVWLLLAACLYFFENNTGTRIVLCGSLLLPLFPAVRRMLFSADQTEQPARRPVTVKTFSYPEEEESGGVRAYRAGDPINRMHWKLSAKRHEWLIRETARESRPEEAKTEDSGWQNGESAGRIRNKGRLFCWAAALFLLLCLLLIPAANRGAQALCNRVFDASERVNAYVYDRFPVPAEQPVALAALLTAALAALWLGAALLSRRRLPAWGFIAGCTAFQIYFGLSLPDWAQVALAAAFGLRMAGRPWKRRETRTFLAVLLAVTVLIALIWPGVDAATEAASERARDALSRSVGQAAEERRETPAGETETRHTHPLSLIEGDGEARAEKKYRLETAEEQQISMPAWIDYLKIALLLLAAAALVILPFLPFLWLNARRKKALAARGVFAAENAGEAICAIFRQVIAWLDAMGCGAGNLLYREWASRLPEIQPGYAQRFSQCAALFEEAAYSDHAMGEEQRRQALALLDETERAMLARADWKQKLRLKYGECLWTEKA